MGPRGALREKLVETRAGVPRRSGAKRICIENLSALVTYHPFLLIRVLRVRERLERRQKGGEVSEHRRPLEFQWDGQKGERGRWSSQIIFLFLQAPWR